MQATPIDSSDDHSPIIHSDQPPLPELPKRTSYDVAKLDPRGVLSTMPLLSRYANDYNPECLSDPRQPLEPYHFIFILHFLHDLIALVEAFKWAGMNPLRANFLYKPYLYPHRETIARCLAGPGSGVSLLTPDTLKRVVEKVVDESRQDGRKIIIVEDGGYVVPLVHEMFPSCQDYFLGAVEQTRKGINKDKGVGELRIPVLSVAESDVKQRHESPMVVVAVLDNIRRMLPNERFTNQKALVIGYGSVGSHIANELKTTLAWQATTMVYDRDPERQRAAMGKGHRVDEDLRSLIPEAKLVIGITGNTSIKQDEILLLKHRSILVSASSDQVEIDLEELKKLSANPRGSPVETNGYGKVGDLYRLTSNQNEILLLAEGFPINFWKVESLPNPVSQLVLTPIFLCALALVERTAEIPIGQPEKDFVDRLIEENRMEELFLAMTR